MKPIGIIANPSSGKDIRRLVARASSFDNNEKVNIVERLILGSQNFGVKKIFLMLDSYFIGHRAMKNLENTKAITAEIIVREGVIYDDRRDTVNFAKAMAKEDIGCLIVLGGDGTNRDVSKHIGDIPLISVSTGTNNVYPNMLEGTIAGIAAAITSSGNGVLEKRKRIEVFKNNEFKDVALIDAAISDVDFVGTKAVWDLEKIEEVIVSCCHPASIGFSAVAASRITVSNDDDFGVVVKRCNDNEEMLIPISAGLIHGMKVSDPKTLDLEVPYIFHAKKNGCILLDGEREVVFAEGDILSFVITRKGPYQVKINETLELMVSEKLNRKSNVIPSKI